MSSAIGMDESTSFSLKLPAYSVKRLVPEDAEVLQQLYEQCTEFALLTDGQPPLPTAAREEFDALPEGKTTQDKYSNRQGGYGINWK